MKSQIEEGIRGRYLHASAGAISDALEARDAMIGELADSAKYSATYQRQKAEAIDAEARTRVDAIVAQAIRDAQRPLNDEEGQIRQALIGSGPDAAAVARAQILAAQAGQATDAETAIETYRDAEFTGNADVQRIVGAAVLARLRDLAAKDAAKATSPAVARYASFRDAFGRWTRDNPSPRERVAQIERQRGHLATSIQESARFALRLHGVRLPPATVELRPVPEMPDQRVKVGPAFDTLTGGHPSNARR